jgi:Raf kinase inhibitor-like YbhB/YbcL family protein
MERKSRIEAGAEHRRPGEPRATVPPATGRVESTRIPAFRAPKETSMKPRPLLATLPLLLFAVKGVAMSLTLTSTAFPHQGEIPLRYTCEASSKPEPSPPLGWTGVPPNAKSLALIVDDPDAPQPPWTHWVLYDLPPASSGLPEGGATLPAGARAGLNSWERPGYGGPCPPSGRHRYVFKLYALDTVLPDLHRPNQEQLERAMQGHVVAHAELIGTYAKRGH